MAACSLSKIVQIISIVGSVFGIVIGILRLAQGSGFTNKIIGVYLLFFCLCLFSVEIYILPCFRFFGFFLKNWGKACCYLLLGLLIFNAHDTLCLISGVIFWVLTILYVILSFVSPGIAKPLAQGAGTINLSTAETDYYVQSTTA